MGDAVAGGMCCAGLDGARKVEKNDDADGWPQQAGSGTIAPISGSGEVKQDMIRPLHFWSVAFGRRADRRLTRRIFVQLPLSVRGQGPRTDSFREDTRTVSINAHGGLMSLLMPVRPGQRLLVTNHGNERTEEALVVWAKPKSPSGMNIGFRFSSAAPQFWANLEIGKNSENGAEGQS